MKIMVTRDTPIDDRMRNDYLVVTAPFTVYVKAGTVESNTSYGSSRCYGNLWQELTVQPGALIADLAGGTYLQTDDGDAVMVKIALSDKHPFEKVYSQWPVDKLERTAKFDLDWVALALGPTDTPSGGDWTDLSTQESSE